MFWTDNHVVSVAFNTLLEKKDVTLKELLSEESILQECKATNKQLVEFLVRPNITLELIQLIIEEPPDNVDLHQRYKYSSIASEVIASQVPGLVDNIANNQEIMEKLYSFLDGKPPLNPLLASYFAKAIEALFTRSYEYNWYAYQFRYLQVVEYSKAYPDFLPKFLNHLGTSGILNSLQYITQTKDFNNIILAWLDSQQMIEQLISIICGTYTPSITDTKSVVNNNNNKVSENVTIDSKVEPNIEEMLIVESSKDVIQKGDGDSSNLTQAKVEKKFGELTITSQNDNSSIECKDSSVIITTPEKQLEEQKEISLSNKQPQDLSTSKQVVKSDDAATIAQQDSGETTNISVAEENVNILENPNVSSSSGESVDNNELTNGPIDQSKLLVDKLFSISTEKQTERLENSRSANASQLICSFISRGRDEVKQNTVNPLFTKCVSDETITYLLKSLFSAPHQKKKMALLNGIQVLLELLSNKTNMSPSGNVVQEELDKITEVVVPFIPNFVEVLKNPPEVEKINQHCAPKKSVGALRLSVAHLFMVLTESMTDSLSLELITNDVFNILLDMFFEYDFNNFLHSSVENMICNSLNSCKGPILSNYVINECKLLERLNDAWDKSESASSPRPGYMGHVIQIVSTLNKTNLCDSLGEPHAEQWVQLKNKLIKAMANQKMSLAPLHDDAAEDQLDPLYKCMPNFTHWWNHYSASDSTQKKTSLEEDENETYNDGESHKMCPSYIVFGNSNTGDNHSDNESLNYLKSWLDDGADWTNPTDNVFDDDDDITGSLPNVDASSSPWNDIGSDDDIQTGWADFGNLQSTNVIPSVPSTFTCEAFAASQQDANFQFCCDNDNKFFGDFTDLRVQDLDVKRLDEIQSDTTITSTLVIDVPPNENPSNIPQFFKTSIETQQPDLTKTPDTVPQEEINDAQNSSVLSKDSEEELSSMKDESNTCINVAKEEPTAPPFPDAQR